MADNIAVSGGLRTGAEQQEASLNRACFERNPESWEKKMENFPKYLAQGQKQKKKLQDEFFHGKNLYKRIAESIIS